MDDVSGMSPLHKCMELSPLYFRVAKPESPLRGASRSRGAKTCQTNAEHCRSEPAREDPEGAACIQDSCVIVGDHREPARSYSGVGICIFWVRLRVCGSEPAREEPEAAACIQDDRVIVFREQARSHREAGICLQ